MTSNLELKRLNMELLKVQASRAELEFKIEERQAEIARLHEHIAIQLKRENELKDQLAKSQEG